jgi:hypothetical protein
MTTEGAIHRGLAWLLGPSWRMTLAAAGAALALVWPEVQALFDGDPATHVRWNAVIGSLLLAWMGRIARDNKVSSEQAGAKP